MMEQTTRNGISELYFLDLHILGLKTNQDKSVNKITTETCIQFMDLTVTGHVTLLLKSQTFEQ